MSKEANEALQRLIDYETLCAQQILKAIFEKKEAKSGKQS